MTCVTIILLPVGTPVLALTRKQAGKLLGAIRPFTEHQRIRIA